MPTSNEILRRPQYEPIVFGGQATQPVVKAGHKIQGTLVSTRTYEACAVIGQPIRPMGLGLDTELMSAKSRWSSSATARQVS